MHTADGWHHSAVLLNEAIDALVTRSDGIYLDGTFGRGGHTRALLQRLSPAARLVAIDRDPEAVESALVGAARIDDSRFSIHHAAFSPCSSSSSSALTKIRRA